MRLWLAVVYSALILMLATGAVLAQGPSAFPVTGKIVQPDGLPAAGATIEARSYGADVGWKTDATATCAADGSYTLQLKQGEYRLAAVLGSLACIGDGIIRVSKTGKASGPTELQLEKGCKVEGTVIDKTSGKPVGGVKIITRDGDRAESDSAGAWSMVLPRDNHTVAALKDSYAWPIVNFTASGDTVKVKVELKPGGTITGKVTDEQGKPIAKASIGVHNSGYFRTQRAQTDAEGRFSLPGQDPDGKVTVWVDANGYESIYDRAVTFPAGKREASADFTLVKLKYRSITGRITKPDGTPIKGAKVAYADGAESANRVCAWSNKDGVYTIKKAGVEKSLVTVTCKDYAPSYRPVEADINAKMDFELKPGHMVEVTVEDEAGNPVPEAGVGAYMKITNARGDEDLYGIAYGTTDKNGHFKLDSLPEGEVYATIVVAGFNVLQNERLKVDRTDYTLVLRKEVKGQICGTVVREADGQPVTEFNVRLGFSRNGGQSSSGLAPGLVDQGVNFQAADGRFVIKGLEPKEGFAIFVTAPGYMEGSADPVIVKSLSDNDYKQTVIRLRPGYPFEGTITAADTGAPIEGAMVSAYNTVGRSAGSITWDMSHSIYHGVSTRTDAGGKFRFDAMPYPAGMVMLEKPGFGRTVFTSVNFREPLTAAMEKGAAISGSVADAQGKVPPDTWLDLRHKELNVRFSGLRVGKDGNFAEDDLPAGEYMIAQYRDGSLTRSISVEVKPGESLKVDWDKQGPVFVHGKVIQSGKPIAGAYISVNSRARGMAWEGSAVTGQDGSFSISLLRPGMCRVSCMVGKWDDPNRISSDKEVKLAEGRNQVDFALPTASITGKLLNPATGKPVAGAAITLSISQTYEQKMGSASLAFATTEPRWWGEGQRKTDKNGVFQAQNLSAGKWMIGTGPGGIPAAIVTLAEGEAKSGLVVKTPQTGSARFTLAGMKALPEGSWISCTDQYGRSYYPKRNKNSWTPEFTYLPVGKMKAVICGGSYLPTPTEFEVKPGRTTVVQIKPAKGTRIVFRPKLEPGDMTPMLISFKITSPDGKPVLTGPESTYWGSSSIHDPLHDRTASVMLKPGKYVVKAGAAPGDSVEYGDEPVLTGFSGTVTVVKGKDTIVEVSVKR